MGQTITTHTKITNIIVYYYYIIYIVVEPKQRQQQVEMDSTHDGGGYTVKAYLDISFTFPL